MNTAITTSRKPSQLTRSLARGLFKFLNAKKYYNRGKSSLEDIFNDMAEKELDYLLIISEYHGNPSRLTLFDKNGNLIAKMRFNLINYVPHKQWEEFKRENPFFDREIPEVFFPFAGDSKDLILSKKGDLLLFKFRDRELIVIKRI